MTQVFCTIITVDYLPFSRTLFKSIRKYDKNVKFVVLIVNSCDRKIKEDFDVLFTDELLERDLILKFQSKYCNDLNAFRWSLKSVFIIHLLKYEFFDQVFFVDPDLYFYSDFKFLYQELDKNSFLLSPHWGCVHPEKSEIYFHRLMCDGIYNAGFLGATLKGLDTLYWWAEMCLYACQKDVVRGFFDDQGFLNLFPILSPDSKILLHKGCNVAEWNRFEVNRGLDSSGNLILDGIYPLVFIHFSNLGYLVEHDPLLVPYLERYELELKKNGYENSLLFPALDFANRQRIKNLGLFEKVIQKIIGKALFSKLKGWKN